MDWSKTIDSEGIPPFPIPGGGDHPTGLSLFTSILLALMNKEKTGLGTSVSTSLLAKRDVLTDVPSPVFSLFINASKIDVKRDNPVG